MEEIKKTILIVEDDKPLRSALVKKFQNEGLNILEAKDGMEGLNIFLKENVDLILLDIVMPVMDGFEMLKKVRKTDKGRSVPVIILTNLSEAKPASKAIENEVYDYLVKTDWTLEEVITKVKNKLK